MNTNFGNNAPDRATAEQRAAFFAHYGVNTVRLHKLTGTGWSGFGSEESALRFDPEGLDAFDYQNHQYREHGIRYALSAVFKLQVGPEDRDRIPFFDEAFTEAGGRRRIKNDAYGLVMASPELQDLVIEQMVALLTHRNPHTGLTYAEDPAVAWIEVINEENAYWYSTMGAVQKVPSLKRAFARRFSAWFEQLRNGEIPTPLRVDQGHDVKAYTSDAVPAEALAIGRCVVDFVDEPQPVEAVDPDDHREDGALVSTTGQLRWYPGAGTDDAYVTIDTPATKAVCGFLPAAPIELDGCTITPREAGYAIIVITALEPDADLTTSEAVLVTAVARARHRGLAPDADKKEIERAGTPPIEMEPVVAEVQFTDSGLTRATLLDHDGRATERERAFDGTLTVDTGADETMYYLLRP